MEGFTYNGKGYIAKDCYFKKNRYRENGNIRLDIFGDCGLGGAEPIVTATLNTDKVLPDNIAVINCYLEQDNNLLKEMIRIGIVQEVIENISVGYVTVPICSLNTEIIKKYLQ